MPISCIEPSGWFKTLLETQRDGLTMNLDKIGYPFDTEAWKAKRVSKTWEPYEQNAYWIDGLVRLGALLRDSEVMGKAVSFLDYLLDKQDSSGYIGPDFLKRVYPKEVVFDPETPLNTYYYGFQRWPHAVIFRAFLAYFSATGDRSILDSLLRHYLNDTMDLSIERCIINVEVMFWIYVHTGNTRIKEMAEGFYRKMNIISPDAPYAVEKMKSPETQAAHGVSFLEMCKLGAVMYMLCGNREYLEASVNAFRKLDRDHMLVDGAPSGQEQLSGKGYLLAHETCDVVDYTWACGYLFMATGDTEWLDKIEWSCYNAGMGSIRKDFKALQYFSAPNQVIATLKSCRPEEFFGSVKAAFAPIHDQYCCAGNINRLFPNFAARQWMIGNNNGRDIIYALLYAPCTLHTVIMGGNTHVCIEQATDYPFSDRISFTVHAAQPTKFTLALRIPEWCRNASVTVNREPFIGMGTDDIVESFEYISREFSDGDTVELSLPMEIEVKSYDKYGYYVQRGPLLYALKIDELWEKDNSTTIETTDQFPAWNVYPLSSFGYALDIHDISARAEFRFNGITEGRPWDMGNAPCEIRLPAKSIRNMYFDVYEKRGEERKRCFDFREQKTKIILTPDISAIKLTEDELSEDVTEITLIPYGCTHIRITLFKEIPQKA